MILIVLSGEILALTFGPDFAASAAVLGALSAGIVFHGLSVVSANLLGRDRRVNGRPAPASTACLSR
jgi:O-antigen/teichoic acid export membrane protein